MPRRNRPKNTRSAKTAPKDRHGHTLGGTRRVESDNQGSWIVQNVPGNSDRTYRCPGCLQPVLGSQPHIVSWPQDSRLSEDEALAQRRHWHTSCWNARHHRKPRGLH